jgi:hypothetical protein
MGEKIRGLGYLRSLLGDEEFKQAIREARESDEFARQVIPSRLLLDHGIPSRYWKVIDHYIDTGDLRKDLIQEPVEVVYRKGEGVVLKLSHDITQPELRQYIDSHWQGEIKFRLDLLAGGRRKRLTVQPFPERDRKVLGDHRNKKSTGLTDEAIGAKYGIDARTVRRIVAKYKADMK